jgi:hypothetical protein
LIVVEQWAEIRRMHFVEGFSIKRIARRTGRDRKTIRRAISSPDPPGYRRAPVGSKLDAHREQIAVLHAITKLARSTRPQWSGVSGARPARRATASRDSRSLAGSVESAIGTVTGRRSVR